MVVLTPLSTASSATIRQLVAMGVVPDANGMCDEDGDVVSVADITTAKSVR